MFDTFTTIGIVFRVLAFIIATVYVLPRAWREVRVGNGLGRLRRLIFIGIFGGYISNAIVSFVNLSRMLGGIEWGMTGFLSLLNGANELFLMLVLFLIYRYDYGRLVK